MVKPIFRAATEGGTNGLRRVQKSACNARKVIGGQNRLEITEQTKRMHEGCRSSGDGPSRRRHETLRSGADPRLPVLSLIPEIIEGIALRSPKVRRVHACMRGGSDPLCRVPANGPRL